MGLDAHAGTCSTVVGVCAQRGDPANATAAPVTAVDCRNSRRVNEGRLMRIMVRERNGMSLPEAGNAEGVELCVGAEDRNVVSACAAIGGRREPE